MADSLRRLVNLGSFTILQDKLRSWHSDYTYNSCDQNVARCCEIIELNARVQGQLFKLLSVCASEGGLFGGASSIKSRLLPLLGQGFFSGGLSSDTSLSVLAEAASGSPGNRQSVEVRRKCEQSLDQLAADLKVTRSENVTLRAELQDTRDELDKQSRASASEKMFAEAELRELKNKLELTEMENDKLQGRLSALGDYERDVRNLRDQVASLSGRHQQLHRVGSGCLVCDANRINGHRYEDHQNGYQSDDDGEFSDELEEIPRYQPPSPLPSLTSQALPRSHSPLAVDHPMQQTRQQQLIGRFNDIFSVGRLQAMDTLRQYSDDHENNQRIIFQAVTEAFNAARPAVLSYRTKLRGRFVLTHSGPESLTEAVQNYLNSHPDPPELYSLTQEVVRALNRSAKLQPPPASALGYDAIGAFLREVCRIAWECQCLAHPLDVVQAAQLEVFDETRYRRSYDSDVTAPLVGHHIWPCLQQEGRVMTKGEACTRRGGSASSISRSYNSHRSPTRHHHASRQLSSSPVPAISPDRLRSRTTTPRAGADHYSTSRTTSTSLSHYIS